MSNSSAQTISSITLDDILADTITLTSSSTSYDTITVDPSYSYQYSTGNTIGSISGAAGTYTIGASNNTISSITLNDFKITMPEEWVNCFPDFDRIETMCKEYPGLKVAYEKFVTTYKLVADHYDTPKDQRPKP
jgi:hypothetical protein